MSSTDSATRRRRNRQSRFAETPVAKVKSTPRAGGSDQRRQQSADSCRQPPPPDTQKNRPPCRAAAAAPATAGEAARGGRRREVVPDVPEVVPDREEQEDVEKYLGKCQYDAAMEETFAQIDQFATLPAFQRLASPRLSRQVLRKLASGS